MLLLLALLAPSYAVSELVSLRNQATIRTKGNSSAIRLGQPHTLQCYDALELRVSSSAMTKAWLRRNAGDDSLSLLSSSSEANASALLHFPSFGHEDAGTYRCAVYLWPRPDGLESQRPADYEEVALDVGWQRMSLLDCPAQQSVRAAHDEELIRCSVVGQPLPTPRWHQNGSAIAQSSDTFRLDPRGLRILRVSPQLSAGQYDVSFAQSSASGSRRFLAASIRVLLHQPPVVESLLLRPAKPKEGHPLTVACRALAQGRAESNVTWTKDGAALEPHRAHIDGSVLEIRNLTVQDAGVYACKVSAPRATSDPGVGDLTAAASVTVNVYRRHVGCISWFPLTNL